MGKKKKDREPDPQPPELKELHQPSLLQMWRMWSIGIAIVAGSLLILAFIFYKTGY